MLAACSGRQARSFSSAPQTRVADSERMWNYSSGATVESQYVRSSGLEVDSRIAIICFLWLYFFLVSCSSHCETVLTIMRRFTPDAAYSHTLFRIGTLLIEPFLISYRGIGTILPRQIWTHNLINASQQLAIELRVPRFLFRRLHH